MTALCRSDVERNLTSNAVPSTICDTFICRHRRQLQDIQLIVSEIQHDTGLLDRFLHDHVEPVGTRRRHNFDEMHKLLVEQHARLTNGLAPFVERLCRSLFEASVFIDKHKRRNDVVVSELTDSDFKSYFGRLRIHMLGKEEQRERLLQRIDMQLKVLYNLQQQRIAEEAKRDNEVMKAIAEATQRDSIEMKGIAFLTMTFLPMTALASIFSMQSFFILNPSNNRLIVSDQFWIFWAVSLPTTGLILAGWSIWRWLAGRQFKSRLPKTRTDAVTFRRRVHRLPPTKSDSESTEFELAEKPPSRKDSGFIFIEGDPRVIQPPPIQAGPNEFGILHMLP